MPKKIILLLFVHCSLLIAVRFPQSITWQRTYNRGNNEIAYQVCPSSENNYFIVGQAATSNGYRIWVVYINAFGDTLWTKVVDSLVGGSRTAVSSNDGGCVISGGGFTVKINSTGNILWRKYYSTHYVQCYDIQRTNDGGYIGCGRQININSDGYIFKTDSLGNLEWEKVYPAADFIQMYSVENLVNGGYIVAGVITDYYSDTSKAYIMRINDVGDTLWTKKFRIIGATEARFIKRINDGYLIGGDTYDETFDTTKIYFVRTDTNANLTYTKIFNTTQSEYFGGMQIINDNRYVFATDRDTTGIVNNGKVMITDQFGNILHDRVYQSPRFIDFHDVMPLVNGDIIFVGESDFNTYTMTDFYALRTDSMLNAPPIGIKPISQNVPSGFYLYQNYPNPFNPTTTIKFDVPCVGAYRNTPLRLVVYDILGREVATLVNQQLKPGRYEVKFDRSNYASGLYFYRLTVNASTLDEIGTGPLTITKKMVLVK